MAETKEIVKVDKQFTRANLDVSTFNRDNRTIEVTFATETPVRTYDWEVGSFKEILSCDPAHVDLTRMKSKAPVLDNHMKYGEVRKLVVGVVEDAWIAEGVCRARLRFSKSKDDEELMDKVADGIITGISAGYDVYAYELTRSTLEGELPTYKAVNWQPTEISFVPVQADVNSRVRSEDSTGHEATIKDTTPAAPVENTDSNPNENNTNNNTNKMAEEVTTPPATPPAAPAPVAPEGLDQARSAARAEERQRIEVIRSVTRSLKLPDTFADTLINDDKVDVNVARERALAEWEKENPLNANPQRVQPETDSEKTRSAMSNALLLRVNPSAAKVMGEDNVRAASEFKGMTLLRMAEESLIRSNVRTHGMSQREIAKAALGEKTRGLHHTTDFPLLLGDTIQRTLLAMYMQQPRTFQSWARRATIADFRSVTRVALTGIFGSLDEVKEGQEYKYGTMSEHGVSYRLAKFGKIIGITWEAIINDDLSAFNRIPQAFAAKAAIKQSDIVYSILIDNPTMYDGKALFHVDHGNYVSTGTALSPTSLNVAFQKFRTQKDEVGDFINVSPKFLIVGPQNEFTAIQMTSTNYTPNKQSDISIAAVTGLITIVDPRITDYSWYLAASPEAVDTVEYAFLDGEEELFMDQREGFNIDGIEVKARMVFAAKAIDWRGLFRNNGAAPA